MSARYTSELANGLGNLASRAPAMVAKYCDGVLPEPTAYTEAETALQALLATTVRDGRRGDACGSTSPAASAR